MRDVEYMLGYPPRPKYYWLFCWVVCAPILISVRILYRSLHVYHSFKLKRINFYLVHHTIFWTILAFFLAMVPSCVGYFLFLRVRFQLLFVYRMVQYTPLKISDGVEYPEYAQTIGWILTCFVMCPIPIFFIYKFITAEGPPLEVRKKYVHILI